MTRMLEAFASRRARAFGSSSLKAQFPCEENCVFDR
ncbi:unnamed protein product [Rhodiola kirilowii]